MTRPWVLAAMACACTYGLARLLGFGIYRSEFLGASLAVGALGGAMLVAFRVFKGPVWMRSAGVFCLNWLFAAYLVSFLAV